MANLSDKAGNQVAGKRYISPEQTITAAGALTLPHGLGVEPVMLRAYLVCKVASLGYVVGDKVDVNTHGGTRDGQGATVGHGVSIVADATNLAVRFGSRVNTFALVRKNNGIVASAVNTSWRLVIVATASVVGLVDSIISTGTGTPEGFVSAGVGSLYTRTDGGASTTLYIKESGTGNTGWVAK